MLCRIEDIKDGNDEVPADFDNEIHKWALECKDWFSYWLIMGIMEIEKIYVFVWY